jgi:hypothetical protein
MLLQMRPINNSKEIAHRQKANGPESLMKRIRTATECVFVLFGETKAKSVPQ